MKLVAVDKITSFLHTSKIDSFHCAMFHGVCRKPEERKTWANTVEHPAHSSLELTLNTFRINPIIQPALTLVIVDELSVLLGREFRIQTKPVHISGVASIEYAEGSMKHWEDPNYRDTGGTPEQLLLRAAKSEPATWAGPSLWEIVLHDGEILAERNPGNAFSRTLTMEPTGDEVEVVGTRNALEVHGAFWSDGVHCFRADVFELLERHFDKDYFAIEVLDL